MRTLILAIVLALLPAVANAQPDVDKARALGRQGIEAYHRGNWDEAFEKLQQADQLHHAPTLALYMARSRRNAGRLLEARELFFALVNEKLPADASQQFRDAQQTAATELQGLESKIPKLQLTVTGSSNFDVTIDGKPVSSVEQPIRLDPGEHQIVVSSGALQARETVSLQAGSGTTSLAIALGDEASEEPSDTSDTSDTGASTDGSLVPAIALFGVGAVGLAVGIATGVLATSKADDVKSRCVDNHCPVGDEELKDEALTFATVSTIGFVIAGVGIAGGVVLAIVRPGGGSGETAVVLGPQGVMLVGSF